MATTGSWEQVTLALIEQNQRQIDEAKSRIAKYERENAVLKEALAIYREKAGNGRLHIDNFSLSKEDVEGKSQMEILRLIASRNGGLLLVKEAVRAMKEAAVFGNPDNADAAVYSALNRRGTFVKVSPGLYRLMPETTVPPNTGNTKQEDTSVADAVRKLKEENPSLTSKEIKDRLLAGGFDFQGKNPSSSVNMALARLRLGKHSGNEQRGVSLFELAS